MIVVTFKKFHSSPNTTRLDVINSRKRKKPGSGKFCALFI